MDQLGGHDQTVGHVLVQIVAVCIAIIILCSAYVRIRYRFWSTQPVFHIYDIQHHLFPRGIISPALPEKTRFYDDSISFCAMDTLTPSEMSAFCRFIRRCYLRDADVDYLPSENNIVSYFSGHQNKSYISLKYDTESLLHVKTNLVTSRPRISSCMTTRPMYCDIFGNNPQVSSLASFELNYVDYLCVGNDSRGKGAASEIIYTHEYHTRRQNKNVTVALFKREDTVMGIVPLCVYDTIGFDMRAWTTVSEIPAVYGKVVRCDPSTYYTVAAFIEETKHQFDIYIGCCAGSMVALMESGNVHVYMLVGAAGQIQCVYFFRDTCTWYDGAKSTALSLFASIQNGISSHLFIHGCKLAITKIVSTDARESYGYFMAEDISSNNVVIDNLKQKTSIHIQSPTSYFFYNFAYRELKSNRTLIIN
jgi:hypothetical protein